MKQQKIRVSQNLTPEESLAAIQEGMAAVYRENGRIGALGMMFMPDDFVKESWEFMNMRPNEKTDQS